MNSKTISVWLEEHDIRLEQSFTVSLRSFAKSYKKTREFEH